MDIRVEDYLSDSEMKEIARDAFANHCAHVFRTDHERIFQNTAHKMVWAEIDKIIDGDVAKIVAQRVAEVIPKISTHTVFRQKDAWERDDSPGQKALQEAVDRHKSAIGERVAYLAGEITKQDLIDQITEGDFTFKLSAS